MGKFEHGFGKQFGAVLLWRRVPSGSLMLAAWSYQTTAAGDKKRENFFLGIQKGRYAVFVGKFEHGFGTELGAGLLWRRVPSGSLMLAAWSYQTTAAGDKKREKVFLGIQKGR